uniref:Uncharacterized protein n=1 Tax=Trieres chinensis TaxID=1514140 RepID=A0A7S2ETD5_TRICV|mmetsp:Transcript_38644/g.78819  ORF Transcript_38644/g.78819 Transcript_38644/m.78819 type:complete len:189 (+) Transcript_38644:101-667(+)
MNAEIEETNATLIKDNPKGTTKRGSAILCGEFRRKWIPGLSSVFSSASDIFGDWVFYFRTFVQDDDKNISIFHLPLLIVCLASTIMFIMTLVNYCKKSKNEVRLADRVKRYLFCNKDLEPETLLLILEDIFEDLPQIILTAMIMIRQDGVTPAGVLNITTSVFNFVLNLLTLLEPKEEKVCENCDGVV